MKIYTFVFWAAMFNVMPAPWNDWGPTAPWLETIWTSVARWFIFSVSYFKLYCFIFCFCSKVAELAWREKPLAPLVFFACCEYPQPCCRCAAHSWFRIYSPCLGQCALPGFFVLSFCLASVFFHYFLLFQVCFNNEYLPQATDPKSRLDDLWHRVKRHHRGNEVSSKLGGLCGF